MLVRDLRALLDREYDLEARACRATFPYHWAHVERLLGGVDADGLRAGDIDRYKETRLREGAARGTVNNELCFLRRALNLALEREVISRAPRIRSLTLDNARQGFLSSEDFARLSRTLAVLDPDVRDLVEALWGLGWRSSELRGLTWGEVDISGLGVALRLPAARHKNRRPKSVRLSASLGALFLRRFGTRAGPNVFAREGRPILDFKGVWMRAVKALGQPGLRPHDLRRAFARRALLAGVPIPTIMELGGWRSMCVFLRYAIIDEAELARALEKIQAGKGA